MNQSVTQDAAVSQKGWADLTAYLYPLGEINQSERKKKNKTKQIKRRHETLTSWGAKTPRNKILPSSSNSDVMDLERIDKAVVGALFGGGGAKNEQEKGKWVKTFLLFSVIDFSE